jgi:hypothetical protein
MTTNEERNIAQCKQICEQCRHDEFQDNNKQLETQTR